MAVPNPDRELTRMQRDLKSGLAPCTVIAGVSEFFRQEAFDLAFAAAPGDVDLRTVDGDRDTDGRELDGLRGGNLFGKGTVLTIRRGEAWLKKNGEGLLAVLDSIGGGCGILLEIKKLDKRTKIAKALVKSGQIYEFRDLYTEPYDRSRSPLDAEMVGWIVSRSRAMKCPLTPESAYLVMSSVGTRPSELVEELQRLAVAVGGSKKALAPADLAGKLTCSFESTPFEFADGLLEYDRGRATRSLTAMYERGAQGRDGAKIDQGGLFPFITSWLYQSLAQLHEGRQLVDQGIQLRDVPGRLGIRVFVDRFLGHLKRNPTARVERGLALLHRAQRELRTTGEDPHYLLLRFLSRYFVDQEQAA